MTIRNRNFDMSWFQGPSRAERRKARRVVIVGLALVSALIAAPVFAQNCGVREDIISKLSDSYNESLAVGGLQTNRGVQSVMEIWASQETGSYTIIVTHADGLSCIVAVGTDFHIETPSNEPEDEPI